jgi:hypothetical protein
MNDAGLTNDGASGGGRAGKLLILLVGIVLGQAVLYGPSLTGQKILLPLDILARPNYYLPAGSELAQTPTHNLQLTDLILFAEPSRRYLGAELHSGRFPLWNPYQFTGVPDILPKFSPFVLLSAAFASPKVLPWIELLKALIAGLGAYCFCRRVLRVAFWPAAVAAWCFPFTGFFVLWVGYGAPAVVLWLPWLLVAVDTTVRRASPVAPVGLAAATGLVLSSGPLDIAGQVLLTSGLYGVWRWFDAWHRQWLTHHAVRAALVLAIGWALGFALAAPYLLPTLNYTRTGVRMARRSAGDEERPPVGLAALPQVVVPVMYGSPERGSITDFPKGQGNLSESSAAAYSGMLATLFLAPLAWCSRRHRSMNLFWVLLGFVALSWCLNVPGMVHLLRLPGLNMMSHNRFVFATSFALLALAAVGLDVLWQGRIQCRWWFWLPALLLAGLCAWCIERALDFPETAAALLADQILQSNKAGWMQDLQDVHQIQTWFARAYSTEALLCALGLAAWVYLLVRKSFRPWLVPVLGLLMVADLVWFAFGRAAQSDPALYFPNIPVLADLARSPPGRIIGRNCLPSLLPSMYGLRDVRGYDAVDPARLINLVAPAVDAQSTAYTYALTQWLSPIGALTPEGNIEVSPILSMLDVRYVIFRGAPQPAARPILQGPDYWVLQNPAALARPFVPGRVETVTDDNERLLKLAAQDFDPREVAYVESPIELPAQCRGSAEIVEETPNRITVTLHMETPGLVVLADLRDKGWRAYLNGKPVPILRTNHAVRGVVVTAGTGTLEFRYAPTSFTWGLGLSGLAAVTLLAWWGVGVWRKRT